LSWKLGRAMSRHESLQLARLFMYPLTNGQILKFGQEVDLDAIEGMSVNKTADELRAALKKLEARGERELAAWDQRLTEAAAELSRVTKANTEKLARVAELTRTQVMLMDSFILFSCSCVLVFLPLRVFFIRSFLILLQHRLESELNAAQSKMVTDVGQSRFVDDEISELSCACL
jgi:hypothetical protein